MLDMVRCSGGGTTFHEIAEDGTLVCGRTAPKDRMIGFNEMTREDAEARGRTLCIRCANAAPNKWIDYVPPRHFKGIYRRECGAKKRCRTGWFVKIIWKGERRSHMFHDDTSGHPEKALEVAITWRNKMEAEMGKPRTEAHIRSSGASSHGQWIRKDGLNVEEGRS